MTIETTAQRVGRGEDGTTAERESLLWLPGAVLAWTVFTTAFLWTVTLRGLFRPEWILLTQTPLLLAAILATIALTVRDAARETLTDRHAGTVFSVVLGVLLVANLAGQHTVIPYRAMALFWGFGLAMALLIVGLQASRPLLVGGLGLLAASVVACRVVDAFHLLLATGWLAGMILPGLALAWRSRRGRAAAL